MQQLDKWNKELERLSKKRYKRMDNELYNVYKDGLKQLKIEIKLYLEIYDTLSFSQRLQIERQLQVASQMSDIIAEISGREERLLRSFITEEGSQGYYGTFYALENAENIQLNFAMLPEDYIEELVNTPVAGKRLSTRLYTKRGKLAKEATNALLQGAFRGEGYAKVAKRIGDLTEANYKQALRIARTEGGRVQSTAKQKSYEEAKARGVDIKKRWLSTLDEKTRQSHQILDGQTVEIEEQFDYAGLKADGPRLFGVAEHDINCRCTTITVVNGISPELRKNNETNEVIKYKNYKGWSDEKLSSLTKDIRSKLTEQQQAIYDEKLKKAPANARKLWDKYRRDLSFKDGEFTEGAFYRVNDGVYMNVEEDIKGSYYSPPGNTFFHEFAHNIDFISAKDKDEFATTETVLSNGKTLGETIFNEVRKHIRNAPGEDKIDRQKALKQALKKDYDENVASMASLSDLFGGATSNQLNLGIGHSNSYWKPSKYSQKKPAQFRNERLGKEGFAEMYAAMLTNPDELEKFVKWLPESYNMFDELLTLLIERGD